jgi:hypothetical protein
LQSLEGRGLNKPAYLLGRFLEAALPPHTRFLLRAPPLLLLLLLLLHLLAALLLLAALAHLHTSFTCYIYVPKCYTRGISSSDSLFPFCRGSRDEGEGEEAQTRKKRAVEPWKIIEDDFAPWLMINGGDDRYQILAATGLNIDPILVVAQTLNIGNILAENLIYRQFRVVFIIRTEKSKKSPRCAQRMQVDCDNVFIS